MIISKIENKVGFKFPKSGEKHVITYDKATNFLLHITKSKY
jgi:hypothetical protein